MADSGGELGGMSIEGRDGGVENGDTPNPRGGVRGVIPSRTLY